MRLRIFAQVLEEAHQDQVGVVLEGASQDGHQGEASSVLGHQDRMQDREDRMAQEGQEDRP